MKTMTMTAINGGDHDKYGSDENESMVMMLMAMMTKMLMTK